MSFATPLLLVVLVATSAWATEIPRLTPELPAAAPVYSSAHERQFSSATATDGSDFLVAWVDGRTGSNAPAVFAARISRNGEVLDPTGIPLGFTQWYAGPNVAWIGNAYLVVWMSAGPGSEALGVRIAPDGSLLDPQPRVLAPHGFNATKFSTDGQLILITFGDGHGRQIGRIFDNELRAVGSDFELATRGQIIDTTAGDDFVILSQEYYQCPPQQCARFVLERVSKSGGSLGMIPFQIELGFPPHVSYLIQADLASDGGSRYILAYTTPFDRGLTVYRFSRDGRVGDPIAVTRPKPAPAQFGVDNPDAVWGQGRFHVAWTAPTDTSDREVWIADLSAEGWLGAPPRPLTSSIEFEFAPSIAVGQSALVVWSRTTAENDSDLFGRFAEPVGSEEFLVAFSAVPQTAPVVATAGTMHLVAWTDIDFGKKKTTLRVARVSARSAALDSTGLVVDERPIRHSISRPTPVSVASDGTSFLIVWTSEDNRLLARRLSTEGRWLDPQPTDTGLTACSLGPQGLVWNGQSYFLAWTKCTSPLYSITAAHLDRSGRPLQNETPIYTIRGAVGTPAVAFDGTQYLVVWNEGFAICNICTCPPPIVSVQAARVSRAGSVGQLIVITEGAAPTSPSISAGGGVFLMSWSTYSDVRATRISPDGRMLDTSSDGPGASLATVRYGSPTTTAWDGARFLVAWEQQVSNTNRQLHATRFAPDRPLTEQPLETFTIAEAPTASEFTANVLDPVAVLTSEGVLVAYSRVAPEREYGSVRRVFTRMLSNTMIRRRGTSRR